MPDQPESPLVAPDANRAEARSTELVVQRPGVHRAMTWPERLHAVRGRLPELAQNPAVAASVAVGATVAGRAAVALAWRALGGSTVGRGGLQVSGVVVHHVVHHHVVHVVETPRALPR
jgi:hypothetical protein